MLNLHQHQSTSKLNVDISSAASSREGHSRFGQAMQQEIPDHGNWRTIQSQAVASLHQIVMQQMQSHMAIFAQQTAPLWLPAVAVPAQHNAATAMAMEEPVLRKMQELQSELEEVRKAERQWLASVQESESEAAACRGQPVGMRIGSKHAVQVLQQHQEIAAQGNAALTEYAGSVGKGSMHVQLSAVPDCKENHSVNPVKYLQPDTVSEEDE